MAAGFTSPPDRHLFNAKVWEFVQMIPTGRVATYGQIAAMVMKSLGINDTKGFVYGPRWVGGSMAACPDGIPWQRVINSQGKISIRGGSESNQREMLKAEGVIFDSHDRVNLKVYQWDGEKTR